MKAVLVNGSPNARGNTFFSLDICARELERAGIEAEIVQIGQLTVAGCASCGACAGGGGCALADEAFRAAAEKLYAAEGLIFGTPVYYAGMNGILKAFMDRVFFSSRGAFRHKVGAGVAVARRCGGMTAFEQITAYFLIAEMLVAPSFYWNAVYGREPGEVHRDAEGVATLENLARNMAWMLGMKEQTRESLPPPAPRPDRPRTHFIR